MGTQQILLIVLSVIIVGIAVAVGITMFNQQAVNSNRNACIADMNNFAAQAMAWYRTPATHGGAGSKAVVAADDIDAIGAWIGFEYASSKLKSGNGEYTLSIVSGDLQFAAVGTENLVTPALQVDFDTGNNKVAVNGTFASE